jgi:arsenate reductase (glutaredoxin)
LHGKAGVRNCNFKELEPSKLSRSTTIVIHHNPDCGTSRNTLEMIRASGEEPIVIEYLKTGWTKPQLLALFAAADLTPKSALRTTKSPAEELGLLGSNTDDETILNAMLEHPVVVNRPIVCSPKGVKLCRPSEIVLDPLPNTEIGSFTKEDGEVVKPIK